MNKLEQTLKQQGVTQSTLAKILNVSRQSVHHWIKGNNDPDKKHMKRIADYLGVSILELFFDE